jgi:hypothetical protein
MNTDVFTGKFTESIWKKNSLNLLCFHSQTFKAKSFVWSSLFSRVFTHKPFKDQRCSETNCCKTDITDYCWWTKKKNKEQSLLQLKEQGAENVSIGYCHPQCFIYRRKQTLHNYEKLKKRTSYDILYLRSCIIS